MVGLWPLEVSIKGKAHFIGRFSNARFGIRRHTLLKEVVLALEGDAFHEIKGVRRFIDLTVAELGTEAIRDELNVLCHQ